MIIYKDSLLKILYDRRIYMKTSKRQTLANYFYISNSKLILWLMASLDSSGSLKELTCSYLRSRPVIVGILIAHRTPFSERNSQTKLLLVTVGYSSPPVAKLTNSRHLLDAETVCLSEIVR